MWSSGLIDFLIFGVIMPLSAIFQLYLSNIVLIIMVPNPDEGPEWLNEVGSWIT
jgi:hypothetical protein